MTPIIVKIINWLTTIKVKYLATTTRSRLVVVYAPMYLDNQRISRGRKLLKMAATAGGTIPDTRV